MLPSAQSLFPYLFVLQSGIRNVRFRHVKNLHVKTKRHPFLPGLSISSSSTSIIREMFRKCEHNSPNCHSIHSRFHSYPGFISGLFHVMCVLGLTLLWLDKTLKLKNTSKKNFQLDNGRRKMFSFEFARDFLESLFGTKGNFSAPWPSFVYTLPPNRSFS